MIRQRVQAGILVLLSCIAFGVWSAVPGSAAGILTVSFLDVGQGDAIFIETPTGRQVLVDGGPDRSVLRELGEILPWFDRSIDVVIATHPDSDHITGLVDVLDRYTVTTIFQSGVQHDTPAVESLLKNVAGEGSREIIARRGQSIDLGDHIRLDILFPDRDPTGMETNDASIVARLVYGETSFLLTGDAPEKIEKYLVQLGGDQLKSTVLKAGHHGSKTSTSLLFVGYVAPEYVVFSRGCDNSYGHPHEEVVRVVQRFNIQIKDTCQDGRVVFESDGAQVVLR